MTWTTDDVLVLAARMAERAGKDALKAEERDDFAEANYWEGFEDGLSLLARRVRSGMEPSCLPPGSCACHPLVIYAQGKRHDA